MEGLSIEQIDEEIMKLQEIEATKGKSGNYYGIDEILGMDIEILEDISSNTDIREYKTKKDNLYYCMLIQHTEAKDLHLTKAALLAVAAALPKTESWKNYKIKINRTGKNFNTVYNITVLGKGISGYAAPPQNPPIQPPLVQGDPRVDILKRLSTGALGDNAFWDFTTKLCGSVSAASEVIQDLKTRGRIINNGGIWMAT